MISGAESGGWTGCQQQVVAFQSSHATSPARFHGHTMLITSSVMILCRWHPSDHPSRSTNPFNHPTPHYPDPPSPLSPYRVIVGVGWAEGLPSLRELRIPARPCVFVSLSSCPSTPVLHHRCSCRQSGSTHARIRIHGMHPIQQISRWGRLWTRRPEQPAPGTEGK